VEFGRGGRRLREIDHFLEAAQATSWIGWQLKEYHRLAGSPPTGSLIDPKSGSLRRSMAERFSRPYAEAVHGQVLKTAYNATSRVFTLRMRPRDRPGQTIVRFNEQFVYPHGFAVSIAPTVPWSYADGRLVVSTEHSAEVDLRVRPVQVRAPLL